MSLPLSTPTFYRMADQSPATGSIDGLLDAIYAALTATTDYRGTSLPSTHLWTVGRQTVITTVAVYLSAPAGTAMGLSPKILFAGALAATPTMASPDSFTASNLLMGITKNGGAFTAFDNANPFTSGTNSGLWRVAGTTWNNTSAIVRAFIAEEIIFLQLIGATTTSQTWMGVGAIVEPHATYAASVGLDAETDDRLYGMWSSGATAPLASAWLNANTVSTAFSHATSAGGAHMMVFQPGSSTLYTGGRKHAFQSASSSTEVLTSGGTFVGDLMPMSRTSGSLTPNGARLGTIRGLYPIGQIQSGRTLRNGSTDLYHAVSVNTAADADAMFIKAAP